jgi:hypothetical protein
MQRVGGRLYGTAMTGQHEYDATVIFLGLVHVFGYLVTRKKNLASQIHKLLVTFN